MRLKDSKRFQYWLGACLWACFIFATLPVTGIVYDIVIRKISFDGVANVLMVILSILFVGYFYKTPRQAKVRACLFVMLVAASYIYMKTMARSPEVKVHFVQYFILGYLIYRAALLDLDHAKASLGAFVVTLAVGYLDEMLQPYVPMRGFQWGDVLMNGIGDFLGLIFRAITFAPASDRGGKTPLQTREIRVS